MDIPTFNSINEKLYSPSQWCNGRCNPEYVVDEHIKIVEKESQKVKNKYPFTADLKYGTRRRQVLDVFEPIEGSCKFNSAPTFVYIHGGYWQALSKEISCYCVMPLIHVGIRVVIADYDLAPDVSLNVIVQEIEELIQYLKQKSAIENWGSLWVGGHSAGAHLAASMLYSDVRDYISGLILISGVYDLRPLITTSINVALSLDENEAKHLSPLLQIQKKSISTFDGPIIMVVGEYESPAFYDQQKLFSTELRKLGKRVATKIIPKNDHFTIVEHLQDQSYFLTQIIKNVILNKVLN